MTAKRYAIRRCVIFGEMRCTLIAAKIVKQELIQKSVRCDVSMSKR
jgi:hypothetical protein